MLEQRIRSSGVHVWMLHESIEKIEERRHEKKLTVHVCTARSSPAANVAVNSFGLASILTPIMK